MATTPISPVMLVITFSFIFTALFFMIYMIWKNGLKESIYPIIKWRLIKRIITILQSSRDEEEFIMNMNKEKITDAMAVMIAKRKGGNYGTGKYETGNGRSGNSAEASGKKDIPRDRGASESRRGELEHNRKSREKSPYFD